uniref:Fe_hyd_lg_C domain-containing protein n=1 Tax=Macrostomum lignano TaxID=282301 RepID=A0A1I8FPY1_9PLAT
RTGSQMEERTRQWLSVPGIPELLGIAQRFGERDDFSDGLLAGQPQSTGCWRRRPRLSDFAVVGAPRLRLPFWTRRLRSGAAQPAGSAGSPGCQPGVANSAPHCADSAAKRIRRSWPPSCCTLAAFGSAGLSGLLVELAVRFASANPEQLAGALDAMLSDNPGRRGRCCRASTDGASVAASLPGAVRSPHAAASPSGGPTAAKRRPVEDLRLVAGQRVLIRSAISAWLAAAGGQQEPQQALLRLTDRLTARCRILCPPASCGRCSRLRWSLAAGRAALDVIELHDSDAIADCLLQRLLSAARLAPSPAPPTQRRRSPRKKRPARSGADWLGALGPASCLRLLRLLDAGPGRPVLPTCWR